MPTSSERREFVEPKHLVAAARELADHWTDAAIEFVRNFDNLVYRIATTPTLYLRITPITHRSREQIESELAVVQHAADSGVPVARPELSRSRCLAHSVLAAGAELVACVFREAEGVPYERWAERDSAEFFRAVGACMGKLHTSLSTFAPAERFSRFHWKQDRWARFAEHVPTSEKSAWELFTELERWTQGLSLDHPDFGFIHGDFTIVNFRIGRSGLCLFDFDSCCRHWRAYEIAAFLHYFGGRDSGTRRRAYDNVLAGYVQNASLPSEVVEQIPMFGKMRLLYSFLVSAEEWGFENLTSEQRAYFDLRRRAFSAESVWSQRGLTRNSS